MAFAFLVNPLSMTASQYDCIMPVLEAAGAGDPPGRACEDPWGDR